MNQTQLELIWAQFEEFWAVYPLHVGKLAAKKAYVKARQIASADDLLKGVSNYRRTKPVNIEWCNPTTFLNQGRWLDERPPRRVRGGLQNYWDA